MQVRGEKIGNVFTQSVNAESSYEELISGEFNRTDVSKRVFRTIKGVFNILNSKSEYIYEIKSNRSLPSLKRSISPKKLEIDTDILANAR